MNSIYLGLTPYHKSEIKCRFARNEVIEIPDSTIENTKKRPNNFFAPDSILKFAQLSSKTSIANLTDQLDDTASLLDLLLSESRDVAGLDDDRGAGETTLSEDLGVSEGEEVEDGGLVASLAVQVLLALLSGDEGPELSGR